MMKVKRKRTQMILNSPKERLIYRLHKRYALSFTIIGKWLDLLGDFFRIVFWAIFNPSGGT
jgi:hypothetical protein